MAPPQAQPLDAGTLPGAGYDTPLDRDVRAGQRAPLPAVIEPAGLGPNAPLINGTTGQPLNLASVTPPPQLHGPPSNPEIQPVAAPAGAAPGALGTPSAVTAILAQPDPKFESFWTRMLPGESHGANVPNFRYDEHHTASGPAQITDTNWHAIAPRLGIDITRYPTAMSAPEPWQKAVAKLMHRMYGSAPWDTAHGGALPVGGGPGGPNTDHSPLMQHLEQTWQEDTANTQKAINEAGAIGKKWAAEATKLPEGSQERKAAIDKMIAAFQEENHHYKQLTSMPPAYKPADFYEQWASPAVLIAGLIGLRARGHMTAALGAAGNAMMAMNQGKWDEYQVHHQQWKDQAEAATTHAKMIMEEIGALTGREKLDWDEYNARVNALKTEYGISNDQAQMWGQLGNQAGVMLQRMDLAQQRADQMAMYGKGYQQFQMQDPDDPKKTISVFGIPSRPETFQKPDGTPVKPGSDIAKASSAAQAMPDEATIDRVAQAIASYQIAPMSGWAMKTRQGAAIMDRVLQINPKYSAQQYHGGLAAESAMGRRGATLMMASNAADQLTPIVQELSGKVSRTNYPDINKVLLAGRERTGDPDVVAFGQAINSLLYVYMRALNPSGIPRVADLERGQHMLQTAWSQGQLDTVLGQMHREIAAEKTALTLSAHELQSMFGGGDSLPLTGEQPGASKQGAVPQGAAKYSVGQIVEHGGKRYRVTGGDLNGDPDVEEVK